MANKNFSRNIDGSGKGGPSHSKGGNNNPKTPERVPAFPGVPGKTQSKSRGSDRKVKIHPQSEGI